MHVILRIFVPTIAEELTHKFQSDISERKRAKRHNVKANRLIRFEQFQAETVEGQNAVIF